MSGNLSLGLTLTAIGTGSVMAAFGSVGKRITSIGQDIEKLKGRQKAATDAMNRGWTIGNTAVAKYAREVTYLDSKIAKLTAHKARLQGLSEQFDKNRTALNESYGSLMGAYAVTRVLGAPIGAFVRQDEAANALQVAMMDKNGQVHESYDALKKQAIELGNLLPGTTADFINTSRALMEQGVAYESVLNGGLKAASYLSVVLRMPSEQAGEMTANLREAYKLTDDELPKMADLMQRGKFAFGMKPSDLLAAASYEAPVLNQLGLSGLENANKMMAIQGMAAQVGLEGSSFGTNFSQMLARLAKGPEMMEMAKKGMKGKAKDIVDGLGITFDFFDKDRNFKGIDAMVKELEKLKLIQDKAGQENALIVADAMFGAEAGRPAMILAEQGLEGFKAAQERMEQQASLQQRILRITKSTANTFEALGGSLENLGAAMAGPAVQALHPLINLLNAATGALTEFAEAHPFAVGVLGGLVGSVLAVTAAFMGLGVIINFGKYAITGLKLIPGLGTGLTWLASGARMAGRAMLFMGRALFMNPIGLAIVGIALGAYLIYRYWEPIKEFFGNLWTGIKGTFEWAWNGIKGVLGEIWSELTTAFNGGLVGISRLILNWSPVGLFYRAFAGVLSWFGVDLPKQFSEFGENLISGLVSGLTSKFTEAKDSIVSLGTATKDWFKEKLGINSPSTVFLGLGGNIGEGAALGILRAVPGVQDATARLAGVALAGAVAAGSAAAGVMPDPQSIRDASRAISHGADSAMVASAGGMSINFAPVIHLGNAGGDVRGQVQEALQLSVRDLEQMLRRIEAERERRAY